MLKLIGVNTGEREDHLAAKLITFLKKYSRKHMHVLQPNLKNFQIFLENLSNSDEERMVLR